MSSENINYTSIESLATDDDFIEWCLHPTAGLDNRWNQWIDKNPDKTHLLEQARELVICLNQAESMDANMSIKKNIWSTLEANIERTEKSDNNSLFTIAKLVAIVVIFLGIFMTYQWLSNKPNNRNDWVEYANVSNDRDSIHLPDNSIVVLEPNSSIEYASNFSSDKREVLFRGEGFFDVKRDTTRPFLIYSNNTITKVLGTSFIIKAKEDELVEVEVITGAVSVYANKDLDQNEEKQIVFKKGDLEFFQPNVKMNIHPNEKVIYRHEAQQMEKKLVDIPRMVTKMELLPKYKFENEPVVSVFEVLSKAYGIKIVYDKKLIDKCTISTELDDTPLFSKLEIICTALDLNFKEKDAVIHIDGSNCG